MTIPGFHSAPTARQSSGLVWMIAQVVTLLLLVMGTVDCGPPRMPEPSAAVRVRSTCPPTSAEDYYFSQDALDQPTRSSALVYHAAQATKYLQAIDAVSLSCGDQRAETYRLIWLHYFRPAAIVVLSRQNTGWLARGVDFQHPITKAPFGVASDHQAAVSQADAQVFLDHLQRAEFWRIAADEPSSANDGPTWMIEGRRDQGYRVVHRHAVLDDALRDATNRLFDLAGVSKPARRTEESNRMMRELFPERAK